jgi:hypothetical protein
MSTKDMHYNIMHKGYDIPLFWEGKIIDFDSEVQAQQFALAAGVDLKHEADIVFQELPFEWRISGDEAFRKLNKRLCKKRMRQMKELKCLVCGADVEVVEDISTHYEEGENGNLDVVITTSGYCTKCNKEHVWNERYAFKGYYDVEVED